MKEKSQVADIDRSVYDIRDKEDDAYRMQEGLTPEIIDKLSKEKDDPVWMQQFRLQSLQIYNEMPVPDWGPSIEGLDMDHIATYVRPKSDMKNDWKDVPQDIKDTFERLGIPQAERKSLAGVGAQYDSELVYHNVKDEVAAQGVVYTDMESALHGEYADMVRKHFMKLVKPTDHKFAALHGAVWSGGSFVVSIFNHSFTSRILQLSKVFKSVDSEKLVSMTDRESKDEIGSMIKNYNRMVSRTNDLIQTVYKNKLKEQEMLVSQKNAELLALHSQINPHFLFNALESIRMHSLLKKENETADMVEKLAIMQRQYVEWGNDAVTVAKECEFVKAYLALQKYRFGERLNYNIDIEADCMECQVPKLTLVTFVENACRNCPSTRTPARRFRC